MSGRNTAVNETAVDPPSRSQQPSRGETLVCDGTAMFCSKLPENAAKNCRGS